MEQQLASNASSPRIWNIDGDEQLVLNAYSGNDLSRLEVEGFICGKYQQNFGAKLSSFLPVLVTANRPGQSFNFAFGLSSAATSDLFLENYLHAPIQDVLARALHAPVRRSEIVELGNLAFSSSGDLHQDFSAIANYCLDLGFKYVVCTATRVLRLGIYKAGVNPIYLADANPENAPNNGTQWGDYYRFSPKVIAGNLRASLQSLKSSGSHDF